MFVSPSSPLILSKYDMKNTALRQIQVTNNLFILIFTVIIDILREISTQSGCYIMVSLIFLGIILFCSILLGSWPKDYVCFSSRVKIQVRCVNVNPTSSLSRSVSQDSNSSILAVPQNMTVCVPCRSMWVTE